MRYLLIALLLTVASASAQTAKGSPASSNKTQTPPPIAQGAAGQGSPVQGTVAQGAPGIDQKVIESAIKAAGSREAAARIEIARGWLQLKQGDIEVAVQSFTLAYTLDPNNVEVYWGLGNAMTQQSKFAAAAAYYERATKIDPQNPKLMADIGLSQTYSAFKSTTDPEMRVSRTSEAMQWFDRAEKIDPYRPEIYANRAIALYLLGNYADAWKNVEKAESLERTSVDPLFIADLTAKQARPASQAPAVSNGLPPVKAEPAPPPPPVQQTSAQPSDATTPSSPPTTRMCPQIRDASAPKPSPATAGTAPTPVKQEHQKPAAAPADKLPGERDKTKEAAAPAKPGAEPPADADSELPDTVPAAAPAPAPQKKSLDVVQEKALPTLGPDKRKCLDLPTNDDIIRCVYPSR